MKVYLCGPINGCTDEECKNWREEAKRKLSTGAETIDPMRRDYRGREDECFKEIVDGDKLDIVGSDILLVNYDKPSVGTSMEILFAFELQKMIILVCKKDTKLSPWLKYHVGTIVNSFDEAFELINCLL